MNLDNPLFSITFKLPSKIESTKGQNLTFPLRSINLYRKCLLPDDALTKRYRARNQFIMARQHIQFLVPGNKILSQKSRIISKVWKTRDKNFEIYFRYLALLDTFYLEDFAKRQSPAQYTPGSYHKSCASTYGKISSVAKPEFRVVKFKTKQLRASMSINNSVFGLQVQDVMKIPSKRS